jgi:hypothetical protein
MKMHEKKLKKFKVYKTITNVLFILVLVFGILGLVVAGVTEGVLVSQGVDLATVLKTTVGQLGIGYDIPIDTIPYSLISIVIIYASIGIGLVAFLLKTLSKMFGNIVETRTPFHNDNIKRLKSMGIAFFIYSGLLFILNSIAGAVVMNIIGGHELTGNISINFASILYGILLMVLAEIFEYGASLQQDSESIV